MKVSYLEYFSADTTEQKFSPAAFKSTFATSLVSPPVPRECTTSNSKSSHVPPLPNSPPPPLPCEPPPPLPCAPPPPRSTAKSFTFSTKSKFGSQHNGKSSFKISTTQKAPVKFNFGQGKNATLVGLGKPRVPLKKANVFGDDESESEDESGNSSADDVESEPEVITSTKEDQQTCLTKAIDYFDTLTNTEKKRKIIRFVRGSDSSGILPGTIGNKKPSALPLSSIVSKQ